MSSTSARRSPAPARSRHTCGPASRRPARRPGRRFPFFRWDADPRVGDAEVQEHSARRGDEPRARTTTSPCSVNLIALPTRLTRICRSRLGSPTTRSGTSGSTSRTISSPLPWAGWPGISGSANDPAGRIDRLDVELARLDLGEVQHVIDPATSSDSADSWTTVEIIALLRVEACPAGARSCRGWHSSACESRDSYWPRTSALGPVRLVGGFFGPFSWASASFCVEMSSAKHRQRSRLPLNTARPLSTWIREPSLRISSFSHGGDSPVVI